MKWLVIWLIVPLVDHLRLLAIMVALIVGAVVRLLPLLRILEQVSIWRYWLISICLLVDWSGRLAVLWLRVTHKELVTLGVVIKCDRIITRVIMLSLVLATKRVIINVASIADCGLDNSLKSTSRRWIPWYFPCNCLFYRSGLGPKQKPYINLRSRSWLAFIKVFN